VGANLRLLLWIRTKGKDEHTKSDTGHEKIESGLTKAWEAARQELLVKEILADECASACSTGHWQGTTELQFVGIARATKGDVTPAGEKFC